MTMTLATGVKLLVGVLFLNGVAALEFQVRKKYRVVNHDGLGTFVAKKIPIDTRLTITGFVSNLVQFTYGDGESYAVNKVTLGKCCQLIPAPPAKPSLTRKLTREHSRSISLSSVMPPLPQASLSRQSSLSGSKRPSSLSNTSTSPSRQSSLSGASAGAPSIQRFPSLSVQYSGKHPRNSNSVSRQSSFSGSGRPSSLSNSNRERFPSLSAQHSGKHPVSVLVNSNSNSMGGRPSSPSNSSTRARSPAVAEPRVSSTLLFAKRTAMVNGNKRYFKIRGNVLECYGGRCNRKRETIELGKNVILLKNTCTTKSGYEITITVNDNEKPYIITGPTAKEVADYLRHDKLEHTQVDWVSFGVTRRRRRLLERLQGF